MAPRVVALLVLSSLANAGLGAGALAFALFATSPHMSDATMRIGFYVLHGLAAAAGAGAVAPWVLAWRRRTGAATAAALLPVILAGLAVVAFLLLDSWIRRTLGG